MDKVLALVLSGAVTGSIYSLMASGLVLTYSTSGIFNFSHAAVAFAVAYAYFELHSGAGLPIVPALVLSVLVFAPLLGLLLDRVLLRRLAAAPVYARLVATFALLVALPNLLEWLVESLGIGVVHAGWLKSLQGTESGVPAPGVGPSPAHGYHLLHGVTLNSDQLAVFGFTSVAAIGLWYLLRRTRVGLTMGAVVDRPVLAGLRGINQASTSAVAWILTMILAGVGGVLITPLFTLDPNEFTLVVLSSLAAVVLAGLRSLPIAFVGGLVIGVLQNLVAGYSNILPPSLGNLPGLGSAVPYLLVLLAALVVGRDRTRRSGVTSEERAPVDHREGLSVLRRSLPWALAIIALLVYSLRYIDVSWLRADVYSQTVIAQSLAIALILLSFVVATGIGGMISLAQPTFATAGGLLAGWALNRNWGINVPLVATHGQLNFFWALLAGTLVGAAVGVVVAMPAMRLGALYLALWSLAAAFFASLVVFSVQAIGHGSAGYAVRSPSLDIPGLNFLHRLILRDGGHFDFSTPEDQIVLLLVVFGLVAAAIGSLQRSASGRAMLAVRSSPAAAAAVGLRADRTRVAFFAVSAGIAGLGGVLLSMFSLSASSSTAPPEVGLGWLVAAVLFGIRRPAGALLAGFSIAAAPAICHWAAGAVPGHAFSVLITSSYFVPMLTGLGAIQVAQEPDGVLAMGSRAGALRRARATAPPTTASATATAPPEVTTTLPEVNSTLAEVNSTLAEVNSTSPVLVAEDVVAGYGDAEVLHGVTLAVHPGEVVAVLGANGAGKSTLCSVLAGTLAPSAGLVMIEGRDVTAAPSFVRARAGCLHIPEARGIFPGLSVADNLEVMVPAGTDLREAYERFPRLAERRRQHAGVLSGGEQQMVALAPALAAPPVVLIADEPTLGLAPLSARVVLDAVLELRRRGVAVLIAEEHASNALEVADTIVVMALGRVVWQGPRAAADVALLSGAYLGVKAPA